ncbi:MAG: hypothetical protein QT03_C0001G1062 [archaeon GW2011_AR10]|uniref:Ferredoxin n=1 Tax=Candidatus Iainarchaeum sp. TaxID=3101447 RepID=A0A7J4IRE1_9ARCH|nr:MAG: hypothetical protein QT03_C0001G1062 [archaeon GW2011_AR10]KKR36710.1 MAG: 4Fe-4S ferredoxin, iron-sulfur binding domain protein [Parcubacteria group bacterium GW2011_GWF2_40_10]HIH08071.1 ferredoxin [Candidatus Diapherotrites archaeon]
MAKFKIVYDRSNCICAGPCAAVAPEHFEIDPSDGKANLKGGKQEGANWVKEIDDDSTANQSVDVCPAAVISVKKIQD